MSEKYDDGCSGCSFDFLCLFKDCENIKKPCGFYIGRCENCNHFEQINSDMGKCGSGLRGKREWCSSWERKQ